MRDLTFCLLIEGFNIPDSSLSRIYERGIDNVGYQIYRMSNAVNMNENYFVRFYDMETNKVLLVKIISSDSMYKLDRFVSPIGSIKTIGSSYFIVLDDEIPKKVPASKKTNEFVMPRIIACDFDGCIAEQRLWPECGDPIWTVINMLKGEMKNGSKIILNTLREGEALKNAIAFCEYHGIRLDAVNENLPELIPYFGDPRKIIATEYWDDKAVNMGIPDPVLTNKLIKELVNSKEQLTSLESIDR